MTSRLRAAELAARRLVAKGHLTERSLDFPGVTAPGTRPAAASVRGGAPNPFLELARQSRLSAETAAGPRGDRSPRVGHPPAPCPAAIPPE